MTTKPTRSVWQRAATSVLALTVSAVTAASIASPASAEAPDSTKVVVSYCGGVVADIQALLNDKGASAALGGLSDNNTNHLIEKFSSVEDYFGWTRAQWCSLAWNLINTGGQMLVESVLLGGLKGSPDEELAKKLLDAYEVYQAVHSGLTIPAVGGGGSGSVTGTVSWTNGLGLTMRTGPGTGYPAVGTLSDGQQVAVLCQVAGDHVGGTNLWSLISFGGSQVYVSDNYLDNGSGRDIGQVAPTC